MSKPSAPGQNPRDAVAAFNGAERHSTMKPLRRGKKELIVVGDRVLIQPEAGENRTKVGLLLPPGAMDKEAVQGGIIVALGPGTPLTPPDEEHEPWKRPRPEARYLPLQAEVGDYAVFFRKAAIEVAFEGEKFLVVPHPALLVLVREPHVPDVLPESI